MDLCNCPDTGALGSIPSSDCPFDINQIQKIAIQKGGNIWDTAAGTPKDIATKADWDLLIAASDDTKIVITPFVTDSTIEPGDFITTGGGDNTTLNGVEKIEGINPSLFTAQFKSITAAQEKAVKAISCTQNLVVYFFNSAGKIIASETSIATQTIGLKVQSVGVKDRRNEGFGTSDTVDIQFSLPSGWSNDLKIVTPIDFNPIEL